MNGSQTEILIACEFARLLDRDWREALVEGGRYSLKSHTVGRVALIRAMSAKTRTLCGREFQNSISESVHQLLADLIELYGLHMFSVTKDSIINTMNGSDFLFKGVRHNAQSIKSIEGIDLFWGEESQTFSAESIDIITPTVRKPGSQIIWTMNRLNELDPIYERTIIKKMPNVLHIQANYDVAEKYGWLPPEIATEIEHDRVTDPDLYAHKWLGQPMSQAEKAIIGRGSVLQAMQRTVSDVGAIEVGCDVARFGDDRTTMYKRKGLKLIGKREYTKLRTTQVCDRLEEFVGWVPNMDRDDEILLKQAILFKVDDTGVGGGVTDIMVERGWRVMPINFGAVATDPDRYPNLISEAWFYLGSIIDTIELPMDSELLMELSNRQWKMDSKGRRGVESKDDYKKRGYRSPDKADGVILCFYNGLVPFDVQPASKDREVEDTLTGSLLDEVF